MTILVIKGVSHATNRMGIVSPAKLDIGVMNVNDGVAEVVYWVHVIKQTEHVHLVVKGTGQAVVGRTAVTIVLEDVDNTCTDIVMHVLMVTGETRASGSAI